MIQFKKGVIASAIIATAAMSAHAQDDTERYIIKYKNNAKQKVIQEIGKAQGQLKKSHDKRRFVAARLNKGQLKKLQASKDIEFIEVDPKRHLMAESTPYGIDMVQAPLVSDSLTGNRTVCIMDTGYSLGHEDLQNSRISGSDGYDSNDTGDWFNDGHGHGTHVAGTIAAIGGNNLGVVGVNPGNNLNLHIVKVFNDSGNWAYGSDLVVAVDQCMDAGANVISMSLGGSGSSAAENNAFANADAAGVLSIAAAGNDGNTAHSYPASYDSVMSVAAVDSSGSHASYSQRTDQVEIAAPGSGVNSTLPNNSYASWNGTSMATPHVSGVAALVWSHYTQCSNTQIRQALNKAAEDRGAAGRDNSYGHGIVKAKDAFDLLADGCDVGPIDPPPPPPPATELQNGVPQTGLSGGSGDELDFEMQLPSGASDLSFNMSGGSGDADLYVRFGAAPTTSTYDCRPYSSGNNESCDFANPQEGTYYVMVRGYSSFSGVDLVGAFSDGAPNEAPTASFTFSCTDLTCTFDGSASSDSDGSVASYSWNFGDGNSASGATPNHTFDADGTYSVSLTVTDNGGATGSDSQNVTVMDSGVGVSIDLSVTTQSKRRWDIAQVRWSGATTASVDIYRNGSLLTTTANDGAYNDRMRSTSGSFTYQVCNQGSTSDCSDSVSVNF